MYVLCSVAVLVTAALAGKAALTGAGMAVIAPTTFTLPSEVFRQQLCLFAVHHAGHLCHSKAGQAELFAGLQQWPNSHSPALQVIDLILLYDGDVMKFAGDSMIVAFSPSKEEQAADDGGLKEATLRCMHCASDLVDKYGEHPIIL